MNPNLTRNDSRLLILVLTTGDIKENLVKWLWYAVPSAPCMCVWDTVHGRPEDDTRNCAVQTFLADRRQFTHLMMIDYDIIPPPRLLDMILHQKSIVTPVLLTWKEEAPLALIMKWDEEEQGYKQDHKAIARMNQGDSLVEVDASGTGCVLVKREVYENLVSNWFRYQYDDVGRLKMGEDFSFYHRVRGLGYQVWIDGRFICGHIGQIDIREVQNTLARRQYKDENSKDTTQEASNGGRDRISIS